MFNYNQKTADIDDRIVSEALGTSNVVDVEGEVVAPRSSGSKGKKTKVAMAVLGLFVLGAGYFVFGPKSSGTSAELAEIANRSAAAAAEMAQAGQPPSLPPGDAPAPGLASEPPPAASPQVAQAPVAAAPAPQATPTPQPVAAPSEMAPSAPKVEAKPADVAPVSKVSAFGGASVKGGAESSSYDARALNESLDREIESKRKKIEDLDQQLKKMYIERRALRGELKSSVNPSRVASVLSDGLVLDNGEVLDVGKSSSYLGGGKLKRVDPNVGTFSLDDGVSHHVGSR